MIQSANSNENSNFFTNDSNSPYDDVVFNCDYIDPNSMSVGKRPANLTIMTFNIQSINSKFSNFKELIYSLALHNNLPDIICLQELWQFPTDSAFVLNEYHPIVYKLRRNQVQDEGVGIYIKKEIEFTLTLYHLYLLTKFLSLLL